MVLQTEHVNAEGVWQEGRLLEVKGVQDGKRLCLREAVVEDDVPEGLCGHKGGADRNTTTL